MWELFKCPTVREEISGENEIEDKEKRDEK